MNETIHYNLVSMGVIPVWIAITIGIGALIIALLLLKSELRSRRGKARVPWLYFIRALIVLTMTVLLLQPVLFIRKEKTRPAGLMILADRSRSMLRTDNYSIQEMLDLAKVLGSSDLKDREVIPAAIGSWLEQESLSRQQGAEEVRRIYDQLSQGLPWGNSFTETLTAEKGRFKKIVDKLRSFADQLEILRKRLKEQDIDEKYLKTVENLLKQGSQISDYLASLNGKVCKADELFRLLERYEEFSINWSKTLSAVEELQEKCDQKYWQKLPDNKRQKISEISRTSRFNLAKGVIKLLTDDPKINETHDVRLVGWDDLNASDALPETDLFIPIAKAVGTTLKETVSGLVLVSDGCQNLPERPAVLRRLKGRDIPLVTVGTGRREAQKDVAILDVQIPRILRSRKPGKMKVLLKTTVAKETPIDVVLSSGKKAIARKPVKADGREQLSVELSFKVPSDSEKVWSVSAKLTKPDAAPENNTFSFGTTVVTQSQRVLLVAPSPRWDIVQLLEVMGTLPCRIDTVFWRTLKKGKPVRRGSGRGKIPLTDSQIKKYDLVILDGPPFPGVKDSDADLFKNYVRSGGNLLLLTDEHGQSYRKLLKFPDSKIEDDASVETKIEIDPKSSLYSVISLAADGAESQSLWRKFPVSRKVFPVPKQNISLLKMNGNSCFSIGFYGRGKIYLLGLSEIFRLRQWDGRPAVERFLTSLLENGLEPLFGDKKEHIALYPSVPVAGGPVYIIIDTSEGGTGKFEMGKDSQSFSFTAQKQDGVSVACVDLTNAGDAEINVANGAKKTTQVVMPISSEYVYFNLNEVFLKQLAEQSNGRYSPLVKLRHSVNGLPKKLARDITVTDIRLWNWPVFLIFLVGLLVLDWVMRRRAGLVL